MAYFDFTCYDYEDYNSDNIKKIDRDKNAYKDALEKWVNENINEIIDRKWKINNIGFIEKSGDFIKLIKEAEFSYTLGAYYSAIALVGVASEDLTKFLAISSDMTNLNKKNQEDRLKEFKKLGVINEETYENLDFIRKIRNEILHFNQDFKLKKNEDLENLCLNLINKLKSSYKKLLQGDEAEISVDMIDKLIKSYAEESVKHDYQYGSTLNKSEFTMKLRYIMAKALDVDIAFAESNSLEKREGLYEVREIDLEIEPKEITLTDQKNGLLFYVDLNLDNIRKISTEDISEGDIIHATIYSKTTALGNTETWYLDKFNKI